MLSFRKIVLSAVAFSVAILGLAVIASCTQDGHGQSAVTVAPTQPRPKAHSERDDLLFIRIDDRTSSGITDFWLKWKIKNTSHQKSDYSFDWEAVDTRTGVRVDSGSELETNVLPGQTATGDTFTTLETAKNIKINITSFDRTASDLL